MKWAIFSCNMAAVVGAVVDGKNNTKIQAAPLGFLNARWTPRGYLLSGQGAQKGIGTLMAAYWLNVTLRMIYTFHAKVMIGC